MLNSRMQISDRRALRSHSRAVSRDSRAVHFNTRIEDSENGIHVQEHVYVHTDESAGSKPVSRDIIYCLSRANNHLEGFAGGEGDW